METSLYIDSSEHLVLGLLDKNLGWIGYVDTKERKGSGILHGLLHELLENHELSIKDLKQVFFTAGPGSYTGMRLGEGMCQVLEMENLKTNSFYHFEVPFLLGENEGVWISKAFKREIFVFEWDGKQSKTGLVPEADLSSHLAEWKSSGLKLYTHFNGIFDQKLTSTSDMIHDQSDKLFAAVARLDERKSPYYYRPDEKEFRVSQPTK